MPNALMQTQLPLPNRRQGKVRDIYDMTLGDGTAALLIVASDRISAFDVVMPNPIPGKGIVLTQISNFWFDMISSKLADKLQHHLISTDPSVVPGLDDQQRDALQGRIMIGRKTQVVPIECVVRGYLAGSGWAEYQKTQTVCGVKLPAGLRQCDKLPEPIFTPATKEESGHDENVSYERACELVGEPIMRRLRDMSLMIYTMARDYAATRGIIIADTKFEFGRVMACPSSGPKSGLAIAPPTGEEQLILIDEVLTPDSSRFWPADDYEPGRDQDSFDKQYVRNYLETLVQQGKWHKSPPGPELPQQVVHNTQAKYLEAYQLLTGTPLTLD